MLPHIAPRQYGQDFQVPDHPDLFRVNSQPPVQFPIVRDIVRRVRNERLKPPFLERFQLRSREVLVQLQSGKQTCTQEGDQERVRFVDGIHGENASYRKLTMCPERLVKVAPDLRDQVVPSDPK